MFVAAVEERSVNRAARRNRQAQSAVSVALRNLEHEAGAHLRHEPRRGACRLTQAGELLYKFAAQMLALRNHAFSALRQPTPAITGRLVLGIGGPGSLGSLLPVSTHSASKIPAFVSRFLEMHPIEFSETLSMGKSIFCCYGKAHQRTTPVPGSLPTRSAVSRKAHPFGCFSPTALLSRSDDFCRNDFQSLGVQRNQESTTGTKPRHCTVFETLEGRLTGCLTRDQGKGSEKWWWSPSGSSRCVVYGSPGSVTGACPCL